MSNLLATLGQQYELMAGTGIQEEVVINFAGAQTGDPGNLSTTPYKLFRVTGLVSAAVYAVVENDVASSGSGTLKVGVQRSDQPGGGSDSTAAFIASTTASQLDTYEIWTGASPQATFIANTVTNFPALAISRDIILSVGTANIDSGRIRFVCLWKPITAGSFVVARGTAAFTSPSASLSPSSSRSPSASVSPSSSLSPSASTSPSASASSSLSPSGSTSPSASLSPSTSTSASVSPSSSASSSASGSPSASLSPSSSISGSASPSLSPSSSTSASNSPSASSSRSLSPSSSISSSPSASVSPSSSISSSPSASLSPSSSISSSPSASVSPSSSLSPSSSISPSPSPSP